jgi:DNA-binding FadR family transcriptional regulator
MLNENADEPKTPKVRAKLLNLVAAELGQEIISGSLTEGAMIPPEAVLCERFGVSRTVVREAVQLLISKGMLSKRPGIGTWVRPTMDWSFLDPTVLQWVQNSDRSAVVLDHLFRFRSAVEPAAAAEAALNATDEQRQALADALERMRAASNDFDAWIDADIDFHTAIYLATNNVFMAPMAVLFRQYFRMSFRVSSSSFHHQHCLAEHVAVYDAIQRQDPVAAQSAVMVLIDNALLDVRTIAEKRSRTT